MYAIPLSLISSENCKMNSSDRMPDVYPDTHWALSFESFENGMCILIHTAPVVVHQPLCPLFADLSRGRKVFQFKSYYCLERGPAAGGASAIAASGGDGSAASIAQRYLLRACRGISPDPICRLRAESFAVRTTGGENGEKV